MIFRILLVFIFCFQFGSAFSQTKKQIIKDIKEIRQLWLVGELDQSLKKCNKALIKANKIDNDSLRGLIYNEIGIIYDYKGEYSNLIFSSL